MRAALFILLFPSTILLLLSTAGNLNPRALQAVPTFSKKSYGGSESIIQPHYRHGIPSGISGEPDYGGLHFTSLSLSIKGEEFSRGIILNDKQIYIRMRRKQLLDMDESTTSDDIDVDPQRYEPFDELPYPSHNGCYRLKWTYGVSAYGNCNEFHSLNFRGMLAHNQNGGIKYLGRGSFRETWLLETPSADDAEGCVLKTNRESEGRTFKNYAYSQTQNEVLAMLETHSSDTTMDIYGYCGTSTIVEPGYEIEPILIPTEWEYVEQEKLDKAQVEDVKPMNSLSPEEKLDVAITMAESIALLHGHPKGVIVSHDIGFDQFLISKKDGLLKQNDFNKIHPLYWNPEKNEYCKFWSHQPSSYRAAEEIRGGYIDESADVVALGKFFYAILTGLRAYYELGGTGKAKKAVLNGELPFIDPRYRTRSIIEGRLVEIMEQMWPYNITDRVDIFTVVSFLRETLAESQ